MNYIHHIRGDLSFRVKRRRLLSGSLHMQIWFEMITCKVDTEQVTAFPRAERLPTRTIFSDMNFRYVKSPAAPSSLTQSACTDSTITLTWTKIPEVYAYQIVRYDSSEDKYVSVGIAKGAGTTTFSDKNLLLKTSSMPDL